ncbi:bifunctional UDP-N-acetylglucosamine diphosphorylase/glucosamine-1-phosphate N-acetyltransferase GlmU [Alphaproteobacteria bacterium LSUCC0684]
MEFASVILAAGAGKRMKSSLPKPLHRLGGKPMLSWALEAAHLAGASRQIVVMPKDALAVTKFLDTYRDITGLDIIPAVQDPPLGTGHAVEAAKPALNMFSGVILVAFADTPLVTAETYRRMADHLLSVDDAAVVCLGFDADDPTGYGRLITSSSGQVEAIVEEKNTNPAEAAIRFVNAGIMAIRAPLAFELLEDCPFNEVSGEKYLTDIVAAARAKGHAALCLKAEQAEVMGINSRHDLALAEAELQKRLRWAAMEAGATLIAPETVHLHYDTVLEKDVIIEPHVVFGPGVIIGEGSEIRAFSHLEGVRTGACCIIGPYARLRPGTTLGEGVRIGNFVETKNTTMGDLSKANHLTYLGDTTVGTKANIGAGTITCNYDGTSKHSTHIGDEAFIGSNTSLVAPVSVGDRAMIGAGSTITEPVEADSLAVARAETRHLSGGAKRFREKRREDVK